MPRGITQCYLPPGRGDIPAIVQGLAETQHAVGVFVTRSTAQLAVHSNCLQFQSAITRTLHRE